MIFSSYQEGIRNMSDNTENSEEPVMCSKCNVAFRNETEFVTHYEKNHR